MTIYHPELKGFDRRVMRELCKRVGADFNKIDFRKENWFMLYSWTEKQQDDYKKWLVSECMKDKKFKGYRKKFTEDSASWFLLSYGWKFKEEKK